MAGVHPREEPFPAPSKEAAGEVNGVQTQVSRTSFSDKVLITITQDGRLAQWVQVPLSAPSPTVMDTALPSARSGALPAIHLTPTTLLGGGNEDRETLGRLYAAQIGSLLSAKNPEDRRTLLVGLGFATVEGGREAFFDTLELVQKVL